MGLKIQVYEIYDIHIWYIYGNRNNEALYFFCVRKKRSTYPSLSFQIEKLILSAFSDSYHYLLFGQMQIISSVETVNECESRLFLS